MQKANRFAAIGLAAAVGALLTGCLGDTLGTDEFSRDCSIPADRIFSSGVLRDGIPALTFPEIIFPGETAGIVSDAERILGVEINGKARAYPLFIMWWHEIVNDTVGGQRVLVTYCPLTGSGLAFDPIVKGTPRQFGVSGLLFENNLIMFDRETESLWNQLLLGAQCGTERGTDLARIPIVETTWGEWHRRHPNSSVLTTNTGFGRNYGENPYRGYDDLNNRQTLAPSSPWDPIRPPKELVLGVHEGGDEVAYPFGLLRETGTAVALNDTIATRPILVTYQAASRTAQAFDRRVGSQTLTFSVADSAEFILTDAETGSTWTSGGVAVAGPLSGERLEPLKDAYTLFWFSWSVYHPNTRLYSPPEE